MATNIAVKVHFRVDADRELSRDEAKAVVERIIGDGQLVLTDEDDQPPFIQVRDSEFGVCNVMVVDDFDDDVDHEFDVDGLDS